MFQSHFKSEFFYIIKDRESGIARATTADYNFKEFSLSFVINLEKNQIMDILRPTAFYRGNQPVLDYEQNFGAMMEDIAKTMNKRVDELKGETIPLSRDEFYTVLQKNSLLQEFIKKVKQYGDSDLTSHIMNAL